MGEKPFTLHRRVVDSYKTGNAILGLGKRIRSVTYLSRVIKSCFEKTNDHDTSIGFFRTLSQELRENFAEEWRKNENPIFSTIIDRIRQLPGRLSKK